MDDLVGGRLNDHRVTQSRALVSVLKKSLEITATNQHSFRKGGFSELSLQFPKKKKKEKEKEKELTEV